MRELKRNAGKNNNNIHLITEERRDDAGKRPSLNHVAMRGKKEIYFLPDSGKGSKNQPQTDFAIIAF